MKKLFIVRHAKSSWEHRQLSDFERPLNPRGLRAAPLVAERLKKSNHLPAKIFSSPAIRAIATARIFASHFQYPLQEIIKVEHFYEASIGAMLNFINEIHDENESVMLFGHNPTFTILAEYLTGNYFGNLPTAAVVGIHFEYEKWQYITKGSGEVFLHEFPKKKED